MFRKLALTLSLAILTLPVSAAAQAGAGLPVQWSQVPDRYAEAVLDAFWAGVIIAAQLILLLG